MVFLSFRGGEQRNRIFFTETEETSVLLHRQSFLLEWQKFSVLQTSFNKFKFRFIVECASIILWTSERISISFGCFFHLKSMVGEFMMVWFYNMMRVVHHKSFACQTRLDFYFISWKSDSMFVPRFSHSHVNIYVGVSVYHYVIFCNVYVFNEIAKLNIVFLGREKCFSRFSSAVHDTVQIFENQKVEKVHRQLNKH